MYSSDFKFFKIFKKRKQKETREQFLSLAHKIDQIEIETSPTTNSLSTRRLSQKKKKKQSQVDLEKKNL